MSSKAHLLYFNEAFPTSYSVLIYFQEKKIEFEAQRLDILALESVPDSGTLSDAISKVPTLEKRNTGGALYIGVEKIFEEYDGTNKIFSMPIKVIQNTIFLF